MAPVSPRSDRQGVGQGAGGDACLFQKGQEEGVNAGEELDLPSGGTGSPEAAAEMRAHLPPLWVGGRRSRRARRKARLKSSGGKGKEKKEGEGPRTPCQNVEEEWDKLVALMSDSTLDRIAEFGSEFFADQGGYYY